MALEESPIWKCRPTSLSLTQYISPALIRSSKMEQDVETKHKTSPTLGGATCKRESTIQNTNERCLYWKTNKGHFDKKDSTDAVSMTNQQSPSNKSSLSTNESCSSVSRLPKSAQQPMNRALLCHAFQIAAQQQQQTRSFLNNSPTA